MREHTPTETTGRGQRGWTLFELMIVLLIITVMALVALPELLDARENYRLTAVAGQLVGDLQKARIWAITKDAEIRIVRLDDDTYSIERNVGGTWTNLENGLDLPDGFQLASSDSAGFNAYGNGDAGTYTITNPNGLTRQVVVELSGRIYAQ